jgi:hypothetical protein
MGFRKLWIAFGLVVAISFVFAAGALAIAAFVIGLRTGGSTRRERFHMPAPASVAGRP